MSALRNDKKVVISVEMSWPAFKALTPTKRKWLGNTEHRLRQLVAKMEAAAFNSRRLARKPNSLQEAR